MAQVKNKTKRCEMCMQFMERELKSESICDKCLSLIEKYESLWRFSDDRDSVYRNGDLLRG
jgi:hypothetical protein